MPFVRDGSPSIESPDPSGHLNRSFNNATIIFYLHLLRLVPSALYAWHRYVVTAVDLSHQAFSL